MPPPPRAALADLAAVVPGGGRGGAEPRRHWLDLPRGERTISNAEVPLPRSPLSLAAGTAHREPLPVVFAGNRRLLAQGARLAETVSAANGLMQGCRGLRPRRNKLKISPFPTGEGGRGDRGQKSKLKAGATGGKRSKPPAGRHSGRSNKCRAGSAPLRTPQRQGQPVPPPAQARGSGGFAPGKIPQNP